MHTCAEQDRDLTEAKIAIATLEVQFSNLANQFFKLENALAALSTKLDTVNTTLTEARGGWRVLLLVGGAAGSAGAALSWLVQHLPGGHP